jgi:ABC-type antimicrobial peptide transport system permease subunit
MTGRRTVLVIIGLLIAAASVTFVIIGLDKADKVASVVGVLVGLAGLGVSIWAYPKSGSLPNVQVIDSMGVEVGNNNDQTNIFGAGLTRKDIGPAQSNGKEHE